MKKRQNEDLSRKPKHYTKCFKKLKIEAVCITATVSSQITLSPEKPSVHQSTAMNSIFIKVKIHTITVSQLTEVAYIDLIGISRVLTKMNHRWFDNVFHPPHFFPVFVVFN